jgi:hypothetical protein
MHYRRSHPRLTFRVFGISLFGFLADAIRPLAPAHFPFAYSPCAPFTRSDARAPA